MGKKFCPCIKMFLPIRMKDRILYIDIFRGIGISLMVAGHIGFGCYFDHFIHAFHMPMFFFISGFLYKSRKDKTLAEQIKKKYKALIIPYIFFGLLNYLFYCVHYGVKLSPLVHLFSLNTCNLPIAGALWFLTAFYGSIIIYICIDTYIESFVKKTILIAIISIGGCFWGRLMPSYLIPFGFNASLVGLALMHVGFICQQTMSSNHKVGIGLLVLFSFLIVPLPFLNGIINMRTGEYSNVFMFFINATLMCVVILLISKRVENFKILKPLSMIGENSIVFLGLNQLVILEVQTIVPLGGGLLMHLILWVLSMTILWVISYVLRNSVLSVLIGK